MYNVSDTFKLAIKQPSRVIKAKIEINGVTYDDEYVVDLSYEDTSNPTSQFQLGSTAAATIKLSLMNVNEVFEVAIFKPYLGLEINGVVEYVSLGVFYADDVERKKNIVNLTLFDSMIKFEQAYFSDLAYPTAITNVINEISTKTGIQFVGVLPNYQINKPEGYTYREMIGFIASLAGGFAKFDRDGKLTIKSYTDTSESITGDQYIDYNKKKDRIYRIDKITVKAGESTLSKGTVQPGGAEVSFENPFMTETILTDVYNKLNGFSYLPTFVKFNGNPALECGDIVTLTTIDNEIIRLPIMRSKLSFQGGLIGEITSEGESENQNSFNSSGSITKKVERVVYEQVLINEALINKATIEDLQATNARIDNLQVDTAMISDLAVTNAKIADASITTAKIADASIGTAKIQTGAITNALIATGAIKTAQIADGSITDAKIVELTANKITSGQLSTERLIIRDPSDPAKSLIYEINNISGALQAVQGETLNGEVITQRSITGDRVVAGAITAREIASKTITANEIATNAITADSGIIADAAITNAKIANAAITGAKIATATITDAHITGVLNAAKIQVGSTTTFASGYDPSTKETPSGAQSKANTAEQNATNVARAMSLGKIVHKDPTFKGGTNGVFLYNNSGGGTVTVSRVSRPADAPTDSPYVMEIKHTGSASPGFGGFYQSIAARASVKFVVKYIIKLPVGYSLYTASNSMGTGYTDKFITPTAGTGKFEEYIRVVQCGTSGTFSSGGHVYISGSPAPTTTAPIVWYLAYAAAFEVTDYDDRLNTALQQSQAYNGVKIDPTGGLVVTRSDNLVQSILNATEGLTIQSRPTTADTYQKQFYVDTDGDVVFSGIAKGAKYISEWQISATEYGKMELDLDKLIFDEGYTMDGAYPYYKYTTTIDNGKFNYYAEQFGKWSRQFELNSTGIYWNGSGQGANGNYHFKQLDNEGAIELYGDIELIVKSDGDMSLQSSGKELLSTNLNGVVNEWGLWSHDKSLTLASEKAVFLKLNNLFDGTSDKFIASNISATQLYNIDGNGQKLAYRVNTNTPTAGSKITWSSARSVLNSNTAPQGKVQSGKALMVANGSQNYVSAFQTFPEAFAGVPHVFLTLSNTENGDITSQLSCGAISPTSTGFHIEVGRPNGAAMKAGNIWVHWAAIY